MADAHRAAKGPSRQRSGQLPTEGREDIWDVTVRCLEAQLVELTQILVANNLTKLAPGAW